MTPKPSEAELRELEEDIRERIVDRDGASPAFLEQRVLPALHALMASLRGAEINAGETLVSLGGAVSVWRDRAEAAEKRAAELLLSKAKLLSMGQEEMRRAEKAEAALANLVDFIATGDFTDDARRQAIAKAETALAGAEAGERRTFEGVVDFMKYVAGPEVLRVDGEPDPIGTERFLGDLYGKRVRVVVEVLSDALEAPQCST